MQNLVCRPGFALSSTKVYHSMVELSEFCDSQACTAQQQKLFLNWIGSGCRSPNVGRNVLGSHKTWGSIHSTNEKKKLN